VVSLPRKGLVKSVEIKALRAIGDRGVSYFAIDIIALRAIVAKFGEANCSRARRSIIKYMTLPPNRLFVAPKA
jgi:hypothetical protein